MTMMGLTEVVNKLVVFVDPELRHVRKIIDDAMSRGGAERSHVSRCDDLFIQRLKVNPLAFKMSFWEGHFEWKALASYPEIKGKILDFGCGSGHSDILLARTGRFIHGVDLSRIGLMIADYLREKEPESVKNRVSFELADMASDSPKRELFDSVWSSHVFEHIRDPKDVINGLRRWVESRSHMLISVPLGHAYDDPGHVHHYENADALRSHLADHIDVLRIDTDDKHRVLKALCRFP